MQYITNSFASIYGCGTYGGSTYQNSTCQASTSGSSAGGSSAGGGLLTNTGFDILLIVTAACFLIFIALVVRMWRRPKQQPPVSGTEQHPVEAGVQDDGQRQAK